MYPFKQHIVSRWACTSNRCPVQLMTFCKKGYLGKGQDALVTFKPDHRGVFIIKIKNTSLIAGIGMEFHASIKIGNKQLDYKLIESALHKPSHDSDSDHDFHMIEQTDVSRSKEEKKKLQQKSKLLKTTESWEIKMDLSDPLSPFFGYFNRIGKDTIDIYLLSGVKIGLRPVYYQVDVIEEFEQMILIEDSITQFGGIGQFETQLNTTGVYKLFMENISQLSNLASLQGMAGVGPNHNFDVTVRSGFLNQFKENIYPSTYHGYGKKEDIIKQLSQYYELYEEGKDAQKTTSVYISDTFPCYLSQTPMEFVIKVQHHAMAHKPAFGQGPLRYRILLGYVPGSKWEVGICEEVLRIGEELTQATQSKDGDRIREIVDQIKVGILKIPKKKMKWSTEFSDPTSETKEENEDDNYEGSFKVNILKFDSNYLQIEISEYYETAKTMVEDLNRLEEDFSRAMQMRFILSEISIENIKQLKMKAENYFLRSKKLTELVEQASEHISKMDSEFMIKSELKEKLKYFEDSVLTPISSSASSMISELFIRNCSKVETEQELNRIYQDAVDFRKRARKIMDSIADNTKGDTQLNLKKLDQYIKILRQQRDLQSEFNQLLATAKSQNDVSSIQHFMDEKGVLLTKDSNPKYVQCMEQIQEELNRIALEKKKEEERKKQEEERRRKEHELKKKKAEEERLKKEAEEKRLLQQKMLEEQQRKLDDFLEMKKTPIVKKEEETPVATTSTNTITVNPQPEEVASQEHPPVVETPKEEVTHQESVTTPQEVTQETPQTPTPVSVTTPQETESIEENNEERDDTEHLDNDLSYTDQDELSSSSNTQSSHSQKGDPEDHKPKKKSPSIKKKKHHEEHESTETIDDGLVIERKKKSDKKKKPKKKSENSRVAELFPETVVDKSFPSLTLPEVTETVPSVVTVTNYSGEQAAPSEDTPTEVVQSLKDNVKQLIYLASQRSQSSITTLAGSNSDEIFFKFNCTNEHPFEEYMERICASIHSLLLEHRLEKKAFLTNKPYRESPLTIIKGLSPQGETIYKDFNKFLDVSNIKKKLPNDENKDINLTHLLIQFCFHKDIMTTILLQLVHFSTIGYLKKFYEADKSLLLNTSYRDELGATIELLKQLKLTFKFFNQYM